jgi:hypothetical protein
MPTYTSDSDDRLPPTGPDIERYERYRLVDTLDDEVLIYDPDREDAWIQSDRSLTLDDWQ